MCSYIFIKSYLLRGGLVPQARGPPMAGLNTMQSQPMVSQHAFLSLFVVFIKESGADKQLNPFAVWIKAEFYFILKSNFFLISLQPV